MPSPYLPHVIYSVAIVTLSIHLVNQRKLSSDERAHVAAQTSILESIRDQLRSGKHLSDEEIGRLKRLARPIKHDAIEGVPDQNIGWKDIFFGPKKDEGLNKWEKKDIEKMQQDMAK